MIKECFLCLSNSVIKLQIHQSNMLSHSWYNIDISQNYLFSLTVKFQLTHVLFVWLLVARGMRELCISEPGMHQLLFYQMHLDHLRLHPLLLLGYDLQSNSADKCHQMIGLCNIKRIYLYLNQRKYGCKLCKKIN